jgi:hypothetical protein
LNDFALRYNANLLFSLLPSSIVLTVLLLVHTDRLRNKQFPLLGTACTDNLSIITFPLFRICEAVANVTWLQFEQSSIRVDFTVTFVSHQLVAKPIRNSNRQLKGVGSTEDI